MNLKKIIKTKARYDPDDDTIRGCKKGTKEWFHEERHRQQFKLMPQALAIFEFAGNYSRYAFSCAFLIYFYLPISAAMNFGSIMVLIIVVTSLFDLGLELDAELYSWRKQDAKSKRR